MDALDLQFEPDGTLRARAFDDTFFQPHDPWGETAHVFVAGNDLAPRFAALRAGETFTVCETGFGTGLSMLVALDAWQRHAPHGARLQFASIEAHPLDAATARRALAPHAAPAAIARLTGCWDAAFGEGTEPAPGVRLRVLVGDVADVVPAVPVADAWFLDGFAPARNPSMWSAEVMAHVAARCVPGATAATFTAAGWVRRNLLAAGFEVERAPGFGRKRHMIRARMAR